MHKPVAVYTKLLATVQLMLITFHYILFFHLNSSKDNPHDNEFQIKVIMNNIEDYEIQNFRLL